MDEHLIENNINKIDEMLDNINFSENEEEKFELNENTYKNELNKINKLYDNNLNEDDTMNTYTGTKHEILEEKRTIPIPIKLNLNDEITFFGQINSIIENNKIIVNNTNLNDNNNILDLDNIIYLENKENFGFVDDVIGNIDNPIYIIKIYPNLIKNKFNVGDKLFYCNEKCKFVNKYNLIGKKGCDASNAFDEEIAENEKDFSDDEEEKNAKKRKNKKFKKDENNLINNNNNNNFNMIVNAPYQNNNNNNEIMNNFNNMINMAMNLNMNPFENPSTIQLNLNNNNNLK